MPKGHGDIMSKNNMNVLDQDGKFEGDSFAEKVGKIKAQKGMVTKKSNEELPGKFPCEMCGKRIAQVRYWIDGAEVHDFLYDYPEFEVDYDEEDIDIFLRVIEYEEFLCFKCAGMPFEDELYDDTDIFEAK